VLRQKIQHLDPVIGRKHQVGALDIPVDYACCMRRLQSLGSLQNVTGRDSGTWRPPRSGKRKQITKGGSVNVFEDQEQPFLILFDSVDRADAWMI